MDRLFRCLAPVIGIFLGSLLGWIIDALVHPIGFASFAVRLFMLIFGIFGWAVATVVAGKKLHCGGTQRIDTATRQKYGWQSALAVFFVILAPMLLMTHLWYFYFPVMFILFACFIGEVGWGNAFRILGVGGDEQKND
jgi:hypothetical protein